MAKGKLIRSQKDGQLVGDIRTRRLNENFRLVENLQKIGQKPATHIIIARAPAGHEFEAGMAWAYEIKRGQAAGLHGMNLLFNDPDYGDPFWVSAFPVANGTWDLTIKTDVGPQDNAPQQEQSGPLDEEIPF